MTRISDLLVLAVICTVLLWSGKSFQNPQSKPNVSRSNSHGLTRSWNKIFQSGHRIDRRIKGQSAQIFLGKKGLVVKRLRSGDSLMVFGPTRSGKTMSIALPALCEFRGPCIVTSVKRDLYQRSIEQRRRYGDCYLFDLTSIDSNFWNIFSLIDGLGDAKDVSDSLCRATHGVSGEFEFWGRLASKALAPLLLAAKESGESFGQVIRWIELQDFDFAFEVLTDHSQFEARTSLDSLTRLDPRTQTSVIATLLSLLEPYSDPFVSKLISTDGIDIAKVLDANSANTLYICSPLFRSERFLGVYEMFLRSILDHAYETVHSKSKVLFLLDELANVAPIPDLDKVASTCSGYGITLISIFQDLAQLDSRYGNRSMTVLNNHKSKLCLAGISDVSTLDYIRKLTLLSDENDDKTNPLLKLNKGSALFIESGSRAESIRLRRFVQQELHGS